MRNSKCTLDEFNLFLSGIDLEKYRQKYSKIKLVELDMSRNVQPIEALYKCYWENGDLLDYDAFYEHYSTSLEAELEAFREATMFSVETFYRGLPARIYRTWASLLTQIQGGYVALTIYDRVDMSAELDYAGIDIRVHTEKVAKGYINIQIKKETVSREVRAPWIGLKKGESITNISYEVMSHSQFTKTGKESVPYKRWAEKWENKLKKLDNGFIIFLPDMFELENIKTP